MTDQEAFEAWLAANKIIQRHAAFRDARGIAEQAWHAAHARLRSQGEPVAFDVWAGDEPYHVFRTEASARNYVEGLSEHHTGARVVPLFLTPQPTIPAGWLIAIDDEMACCHLGVADATDTYHQAREKLHQIIAWHIAIAIDPTVNGGWQLVPIEPTKEMRVAAVQKRYGMTAYRCTSREDLVLLEEAFAAAWEAALDAAPEPRK